MVDLLILTHAKGTTAGTLTEWCQNRKITFDVIESSRFFELDHKLAHSALAVMGGDMQAWEVDKYHWLSKEKQLIADFVQAGRPVLGICLGAQLLAEQLGSQINTIGEWEFGWFPVNLTNGSELYPLHCHNARFDLPAGARKLASSRVCETEAFVTDQCLGFQFHAEIDSKRMKYIIDHRDESARGHVQSSSEMQAGYKTHGENLRKFFHSSLDQWWESANSVRQSESDVSLIGP